MGGDSRSCRTFTQTHFRVVTFVSDKSIIPVTAVKLTLHYSRSSLVRFSSVSGKVRQIAAAKTKLRIAVDIAKASPKALARAAVAGGENSEIIRPQLKIDAAVDRKWAGYISANQGPQITLAGSINPKNTPSMRNWNKFVSTKRYAAIAAAAAIKPT